MPSKTKSRVVLPAGLPQSAYDVLTKRFGICALFNIVHPDGNPARLDQLQQLSNCQVALTAQLDIADYFNDWFSTDEEKGVILDLLSDFGKRYDRSKAKKLTSLRTLKDVIDGPEWDPHLVSFCAEFASKYPEAYGIITRSFATNTDVTLFHDPAGTIANWTIDYTHDIYQETDIGKPASEVKVRPLRPLLRAMSAQLGNEYLAKRLLKHTSERYQALYQDEPIQEWLDVADQLHASLITITDVVEPKTGPPIRVGALFPETMAWFLISAREKRPLTFRIRRREMSVIGNHEQVVSEDEATFGEVSFADVGDKCYRLTDAYTLVALPKDDGSGFYFVDQWSRELDGKVMGYVDCVSYYNKGTDADNLRTSDDALHRKAVMAADPIAMILPMLIAHPPHNGLVAGRNSPRYNVYHEVSPPPKELEVTHTLLQEFSFGAYNKHLKQASLSDWSTYGLSIAAEYNLWNTTEYSFAQSARPLTLRQEEITIAPRHLLLTTPNQARSSCERLLRLQKKADRQGAHVGRYGIRIKTAVLNALDIATATTIAAIASSNTRFNAYKTKYSENSCFFDLI